MVTNTFQMSRKNKTVLRCTNICFDKKPKKDRKGAMLVLKLETASGSWSTTRPFEDVWKFVVESGKQHKKEKTLSKLARNLSKYRDEYLKQDKHANAFKLVRDMLNAMGKNPKILSSDSKISAFVGAKRANLSDIKSAKKLKKNSSAASASTSAPAPAASIGSATMASSLAAMPAASAASASAAASASETEAAQEAEEAAAVGVSDRASSSSLSVISSLKQQLSEMSVLKRKHLSEVSSLKQEKHNLEQQNQSLRETSEAQEEARLELEERVADMSRELGRDVIDEDVGAVFGGPEFAAAEEDPAEKYFQQAKQQKKRIAALESQLVELSNENGRLKTQLERAKYVADNLALEVTELSNPQYEQLEQDYKEVEAELDEVTQINQRYEQEMTESAKTLDAKEVQIAEMRPKFEDHAALEAKLEQLRKEHTEAVGRLAQLQEERDDFEDTQPRTQLGLQPRTKQSASFAKHLRREQSRHQAFRGDALRREEVCRCRATCAYGWYGVAAPRSV